MDKHLRRDKPPSRKEMLERLESGEKSRKRAREEALIEENYRKKMREDLESIRSKLYPESQLVESFETSSKKKFEEELNMARRYANDDQYALEKYEKLVMHKCRMIDRGKKLLIKDQPQPKELTLDRGNVDKEYLLKVSWDKSSVTYESQDLRKVFERFGVVAAVVVKDRPNKRGLALIEMASKESVVDAINIARHIEDSFLKVEPMVKQL